MPALASTLGNLAARHRVAYGRPRAGVGFACASVEFVEAVVARGAFCAVVARVRECRICSTCNHPRREGAPAHGACSSRQRRPAV